MRRAPALPVLWFCAWALAGAAPAHAAATPARPPYRPPLLAPRLRPIAAELDSLVAHRRFDRLMPRLDSLVETARAAHDPLLLGEALIRRGGARTFGRPRDAESDLREALTLARARRDTLSELRSLRWLGFALLQQGDVARARPIYDRFLQLAALRHDPHHEGYARMGRAYIALNSGRADDARIGYQRSIALLEYTADAEGELNARVGLARAFGALHRAEEERDCYLRILVDSRRAGVRFTEAYALNNLGTIEYALGDAASAVERWRQAVALLRAEGHQASLDVPLTNFASALSYLQRDDEAVALFGEVIADAAKRRNLPAEIEARQGRAEANFQRGRSEEAGADAIWILAHVDSLPPVDGASNSAEAIGILRLVGRPAEALARAEAERQRFGKVLSGTRRNDLELEIAQSLMQLGRPREALAYFESLRTRPIAGGVGRSRMMLQYGRCDLALGRVDSAIARLRDAVSGWERSRARQRDFEWREATTGNGARLQHALVSALLDPRRAGDRARHEREAFEELQAFKARTLRERMAGPAGAATPAAGAPLTLDRLQRSVLRDGELFLDYYDGQDTSYVFAVTRHTFRVAALPAFRGLATTWTRYRDLLTTGNPATAENEPVRLAAARRLGDIVFGPVADLLASSRRVLIGGEGALIVAPFASLSPGAADAPLLEGREVVAVPSASVLADLRTRPHRPAPRKLLALARTTDARGNAYAGVDREVRWLADQFDGVVVRAEGARRRVASLTTDLVAFEALHVAAHTEVNPTSPWRSGILLGADDGSLGDPYLRATTIAHMRLNARLAVLSGCQSYGARVLPGEGVLGFSSAFLAAGVPTVICTLWPVDDEPTAALMREFYGALADGATAGAALRQAQRSLRARPATRHPFFWAGFVLVGEPDTRLLLKSRQRLPLLHLRTR